MAPPKQKATASYELIETGGGEGYGSVEPASADSANEEYDKYDGGETPRRKLLSLDTTTERAIQHSLTEASKGRTTLVVAHRLSTIIGADEIIVLRDGRAVERGTHAALAKKPKGLYAGLWKAQSGTEKKGYLSAEECRRHIDKACPPGCPIPRERPLLRTVSLPAPRPAIQDDNDLIYRPAPAAVEQVVELHEEE